MSDQDDKVFEGLKGFFNNPIVTAGMALASVVLLPLAIKMQNTPEGRERLLRQREDRIRREDSRRGQDLSDARNQAYQDYFSTGLGRKILNELCTVTIGPVQPADDVVREPPSDHYRRGWRVRRNGTRTALEGDWDRDGCGGLRLTLPDGMIWSLPTNGHNSGRQFFMQEYDLKRPPRSGERPLFDPEAAEIAAPLLAAVRGAPAEITLYRANYFETRKRLWDEYLDAHPELEDDWRRDMRRRRAAR
jgi:hypothetical protein